MARTEVTAKANGYIVDLGATGTVYGAASALVRYLGKGQKIPLLVQIVEDFNNMTSVAIQTND